MSLQGEKDWQKYEVARRLKGVVDKIRSQYRDDWKSREMKTRQRAVALYFIDKVLGTLLLVQRLAWVVFMPASSMLCRITHEHDSPLSSGGGCACYSPRR